MLETLKKSWSKVRHKWKVFKIEAEYRFFFKVNRVFYWGAKRYDAPYLLFVAEYRTMLEYKTNVVGINPKNTSRKCNVCGNIDAKSRKSQSEFVCTTCGHTENADTNAGKNIVGGDTAFNRQREALACA